MNEQEDQQRKQPEVTGEKNEAWRAFGLVSAIGLDLAICTIGGTFLGRFLDGLLGTSPWLLLVGIILGLAVGIYGITKLIAAFNPEQKK
ncbi:AtpZ/AtpI family protein [Tumebacillus lipolyticus]|uniref:AtpZ/AtpI family protein n=1 Tax=Tumebacillus lipolyticus TaxID=1280370 RepID=A0ABW5A2E3_9BACL